LGGILPHASSAAPRAWAECNAMSTPVCIANAVARRDRRARNQFAVDPGAYAGIAETAIERPDALSSRL
jgi:hypothetical protein